MADITTIQWADTTVNPIMGCGGCELFPQPDKVLGAIDTAVAATGETWADGQNEAADRKLESELRGTGRWMRRVTGYSPTTQHCEPGWAVAMEWQEACDLGRRFLQDAIYVVSGDALTVTYCDERRALVPVGSFLDRLTPF